MTGGRSLLNGCPDRERVRWTVGPVNVRATAATTAGDESLERIRRGGGCTSCVPIPPSASVTNTTIGWPRLLAVRPRFDGASLTASGCAVAAAVTTVGGASRDRVRPRAPGANSTLTGRDVPAPFITTGAARFGFAIPRRLYARSTLTGRNVTLAPTTMGDRSRQSTIRPAYRRVSAR